MVEIVAHVELVEPQGHSEGGVGWREERRSEEGQGYVRSECVSVRCTREELHV